MIQSLENGHYKLYETKNYTRILELGQQKYAWIDANEIGEILISAKDSTKADHFLAQGSFRLYKVRGEPDLTDLEHLELFVGDNLWQGYLLPTGLPSTIKKRKRIIATKEIISKITH